MSSPNNDLFLSIINNPEIKDLDKQTDPKVMNTSVELWTILDEANKLSKDELLDLSQVVMPHSKTLGGLFLFWAKEK